MIIGVPQAIGLRGTSSPVVLDPLVVPPSATGAGTWAAAVNTACLHNGVFDNNAAKANADNVSYTLYLPKGVYTFFGNFIKGTDAGKVDVSLDGTKIISVTDLYAGSASYTYSLTVASVAVSNAGLHTLLIAANGKHTSSSSYRIGFTSISFVRTA